MATPLADLNDSQLNDLEIDSLKTDSPKTDSPKTNSSKQKSRPRAIASGADVGMVPVSNRNATDDQETDKAEPTAASATATSSPAALAPKLSPQDRKNQATQRQLETALADALPKGRASISQGLILGLEPALSGKALTVILTERWYQLTPDQQDAIASALWNQRSSLRIQQLDLQDPEGRTVARPPVIGNQVVILRR